MSDRNSNFLSKFGGQGSRDNQLSYPQGLSINGDGDIIVADEGNKLIKIFSSSGKYLRKFCSLRSKRFLARFV